MAEDEDEETPEEEGSEDEQSEEESAGEEEASAEGGDDGGGAEEKPSGGDDEDEEGEDDEDEDGEGKPGVTPIKLLIIVGVVFVVLFGGLAVAYFTGLLDPVIGMMVGEETEEDKEIAPGLELPEQGTLFNHFQVDSMLISLKAKGRKPSFLKLEITLEMAEAFDPELVRKKIPRVMNAFQAQLQNVEARHLRGAEGMYVLKEDLLRRTNMILAPIRVNAILVRSMVIQ